MNRMFSKKKREGKEIETLIGAGTVVTGDLAFRGGLHLDGRVVGDVNGEAGTVATLTIGADGVIEGSVTVDELVLQGRVSGDVAARDRVELGSTAQVDGNVAYGVLEMAAGARVNGRLIHQAAGQQAAPSQVTESGYGDTSAPDGDEVPGVR